MRELSPGTMPLQPEHPGAEGSMAVSPPVYSRWGRVGLALVTALSLTSLGGNEAPADSPVPSVAAPAEVPTIERPNVLQAAVDPLHPCARPDKAALKDTPERYYDVAQFCDNAMKRGRTALLTFSMDTAHAEIIADAAEKEVQAATGGLANPSIEVVPLPDSIKAEYKKKVGDCVDETEYVSAFADEAMAKQLRPYSFVIGLNELDPCVEDVSSLMNPGSNTHIEIFSFAPSAKQMENEGYRQAMAKTIAHEHAHGYGAADENGVTRVDVTGEYAGIETYQDLMNLGGTHAFDFNAYLDPANGSTTLDESGSNGLMGLASESTMNLVTKDCIAWPKRVLRGQDASLGETVGPQGAIATEITSEQAVAGDFVHIELDEPLVVKEIFSEGTHIPMGTYDGMAVALKVPASDSTVPFEPGVDLLLTESNTCKTAMLGSLAPSPESQRSQPWTFQINGNQYAVDLDANRLTVTPQ